jgi:hypothetical protein
MGTVTVTSGDAYAQSLSMIRETGVTNSQAHYGTTGVVPYSAGYASISTATITTTATSYINIDCSDSTSTTGSEYCGIQGYTVELISP